MLCKKPNRNGVMEYGCGQWMPCRVNKYREWVGRMMMESMEHQSSCFITLTFNEECLPGAGLQNRPLQLFLKRLRQKVGALRYFAVGEYGDQTWRPHYHLIVFGVSPVQEELIRSCWTLGYVHVGTAELGSMNYIVGYVLKKISRPGLAALQGRSPEFALMSQKPGLGYGVVERIKKAFKDAPASNILMGVMPAMKSIRVCGKKYPLGRYLREKALDSLGFTADQREDFRVATMAAVAERKDLCSTVEYEVQRKARVQQQSTERKVRSL